jgi:cytidylate kinase
MAIITISRGPYSGGAALAKSLGKKLDYRLLSREALLAIAAKRFGLSPGELEAALVFRPRFLDNNAIRLRHVYCMQAVLAEQVKSDNVVYHGEAGHLLLRGIRHHCRVKIIADLKSRVRAVIAGGDRKDPLKHIEDVDATRDQWIRRVYGVDRNDLLYYDVAINLEQMTIEDACAIVAEAVSRGFKTTPESQAQLEDYWFASEVRARIGMDRRISWSGVNIAATAGVVTLTGTVTSAQDADNIRELVCSTDGVRNVVSKMTVRC